MRKTTTHGRKLKRLQAHAQPGQAIAAHASPVGRAVIAREEIDSVTELMTYMTSVSTRIYFTLDGERDPKLLANLALVLGVGAEVALALVPHHPEAKRLHAALRTVLQFSVDGGRWQSSQAKILHEAAQLATEVFLERSTLGTLFFPGAFELAEKVRNGTARMSDVAGAEVYNQKAATASGAQG
ncbi:hypothetical protein [Polaromonas naphthalenivorans]|uniref:Uncharacterized protein n=1 Tax=Polaromonas naphthalenivorans (strain CJ2) TaxID=365044 RepID=A1VPK7_POLNA|nr:hypothetical protein [Polaromonas naphthalenivorans]ABM37585.1 hypothetical protein Pnap_2277 [Polaromonas naphthalenivorans CJ2]